MNLVKKKLVNSVIKRLLIILLLPLAFIGCTDKKMQKFESEKFLFGTYIKITVYDKDEKLAKKGMEEAFNEIERLDNKFNSKIKTSIIGKLNSDPATPVELDDEGLMLFSKVREVYELSDKKYDITIGPLLKAWGFGEVGEVSIPSKEFLAQILTEIDFDKVKIEGNQMYMESPVNEIDTGSFLKGYAVARAKKVMEEMGITSAFITTISSIDVINTKPENKPWRIGVQNPENPEDLLGIVELNDEGMGVSGDYQTYVEINGKKYHHILDKATGFPVRDKKLVMVICEDAFLADLYSTAFFTMPVEKVMKYAENNKKLKVLIVDKDMNILKTKNLNFLKK
ncbi:FAD:protein FMN transferase [Fusobacterium varium]|uniref:FAD:protein FMN transferase n=1 Tax=Fusobacterium varium TaxID=856 RepID=UPI000BBA9700|nr:FAD:protein FMN transferase [uncultured Fusobacterium sp.]